MKVSDLGSISAEELWKLFEAATAQLGNKLAAEKAKLQEREERLLKLQSMGIVIGPDLRRPYPKVFPKYQNPKDLAETWSGRGKQPRWLTAELRSGAKLESFLIARPGEKRGRQTG
jgi:DNA-binding protein H-NS